MPINSRVPASGELLKTDGTIINQADVLADVYDTGTHSIRAKLETEGVTFEVNEADLTAIKTVAEDAHDADNHALRVHETATAELLEALGLLSTAGKQDAVLAAVGLLAKLTDTQPVKVADDAYAIVSAPVVKRQSVSNVASQIVLTDDAGVAIDPANISAVRIHNLGATDLYIGTVSTLTTSAKSDRVSPDGEITFSFQRGSSAASALWFIREAATEDISVTIVRWD
jgi:hypothetical protein